MESRIAGLMALSDIIFAAGDKALESLRRQPARRRRQGSYKTRRPGPYTPFWNQFRIALRSELKPYGAKVRLARYLGISKQRISDFLAGRRRMPDAEVTPQMLHWLLAKRDGIDLSL